VVSAEATRTRNVTPRKKKGKARAKRPAEPKRVALPKLDPEGVQERLRQLRQMIVLGLPESEVKKKLGVGTTLRPADYEVIRRELTQEKRGINRFALYVECDERMEYLWRAGVELIQLTKGRKAADGSWEVEPDPRTMAAAIKTAKEIQESKVYLAFRLGGVEELPTRYEMRHGLTPDAAATVAWAVGNPLTWSPEQLAEYRKTGAVPTAPPSARGVGPSMSPFLPPRAILSAKFEEA
jgi:hypothetical protein